MGVVVLVVSNLSGSTTTLGLLARVVGAVVAGSLTFGAVVVWLGRRHDARRRPRERPVGPLGAPRSAPAAPEPPSGLFAPPPPWQTPPMPGVHIVTDSACDLTDQLVKEHNIIVVPLTIRFGEEELEDRRQLSCEEFWDRCRGKGALPETAAPSPGAFQAAFQQAADEGADAVLCLTLSSKVSGTYSSAVTAAGSFDAVPVRVVDTFSLTMGQGLLVIAAAEEAAAGASLDELVAATEDRIPRTRIYGVLGRARVPPARRAHRWGPRPGRFPVEHQAGDPAQGRRGGRGVQAAHPAPAPWPTWAPRWRRTRPSSGSPWPTAPATTSPQILAVLAGIATEHPCSPVDLGPVVGTHAGPEHRRGLLHRACQDSRDRRVVSRRG